MDTTPTGEMLAALAMHNNPEGGLMGIKPTVDVEQAERFLRTQAPGDEFLQFIRALVETGALREGGWERYSAFVYFLEKPWKWAGEYAAWVEAGRPMDDSEPGWEQFWTGIET
jgi:hypothetical protein